MAPPKPTSRIMAPMRLRHVYRSKIFNFMLSLVYSFLFPF
jgi:hypothetical protein